MISQFPDIYREPLPGRVRACTKHAELYRVLRFLLSCIKSSIYFTKNTHTTLESSQIALTEGGLVC